MSNYSLCTLLEWLASAYTHPVVIEMIRIELDRRGHAL